MRSLTAIPSRFLSILDFEHDSLATLTTEIDDDVGALCGAEQDVSSLDRPGKQARPSANHNGDFSA